MGDVAEGERLLVRCLDEYPGFLGSIYPLALIMLRRGASGASVVETVSSRAERMSPSMRFMLGTALYEAAETAAAEEQFRGVVESQPSSGPARAALAEALVSQARWQEAAETAEKVESGLPCARAARRTELFARLMAGDVADAAEALERAAADLPEAEAALFCAWLGIARGGNLPASLPGDAAGLLLSALEALLRVTEIDAFVQLLPLLELVGLPVRERRELLAGIYLRRGFLDSAADEWIAVCRELGTDAAALIGLAQVAYARELPSDALEFAREARALDPANAGASRLIETLAAAA